ncbi:MAG: hypothetical protein KDK65_01120 [Chlamydiia bacterium]|nr:hypothetical protein [Chlamydiia bacterium]
MFVRLVLTLFLFTTCLAEDTVALLFLTRRDPNHADLWAEEIAKESNHFTVYVHPKEELEHPFFKRRKIKKSVPTSWDKHYGAWVALLKAALKDRRNKKFCFLSESCVPLHPLGEIYSRLMADFHSYICYATPEGKAHTHAVKELPKQHRWVNHEWIILNRKHARLVAMDREILPICEVYPIDNEVYPASLLSVKGCLNPNEVHNQLSTFVLWTATSYLHPKMFTEGTPEEMALLLAGKERCFFARKFSKQFPSHLLRQLLHPKS